MQEHAIIWATADPVRRSYRRKQSIPACSSWTAGRRAATWHIYLSKLWSPTAWVFFLLQLTLQFFSSITFFLRNLIYYQRIHNRRKISPQAFLPFLHAKSLASLLFLPLSSLALLPCLAAGTFEEIFLHPTSFPSCSSSIMVPLLRDLFSFSELCPHVPSLPWASIQPSHRITES